MTGSPEGGGVMVKNVLWDSLKISAEASSSFEQNLSVYVCGEENPGQECALQGPGRKSWC